LGGRLTMERLVKEVDKKIIDYEEMDRKIDIEGKNVIGNMIKNDMKDFVLLNRNYYDTIMGTTKGSNETKYYIASIFFHLGKKFSEQEKE